MPDKCSMKCLEGESYGEDNHKRQPKRNSHRPCYLRMAVPIARSSASSCPRGTKAPRPQCGNSLMSFLAMGHGNWHWQRRVLEQAAGRGCQAARAERIDAAAGANGALDTQQRQRHARKLYRRGARARQQHIHTHMAAATPTYTTVAHPHATAWRGD
ncbi:hypothetical protein ACP70R_011253 [Stipagrostis hirtigluma subsp. patula]